jgi:hypothetical protein
MTQAADHITSELRSVSMALPNTLPMMLRDELNDIAMTAISIYESAMRELVTRHDSAVLA